MQRLRHQERQRGNALVEAVRHFQQQDAIDDAAQLLGRCASATLARRRNARNARTHARRHTRARTHTQPRTHARTSTHAHAHAHTHPPAHDTSTPLHCSDDDEYDEEGAEKRRETLRQLKEREAREGEPSPSRLGRVVQRRHAKPQAGAHEPTEEEEEAQEKVARRAIHELDATDRCTTATLPPAHANLPTSPTA